ncbi:hypothetical protein BDZ91DRAFT_834697 [Kalaharituber pfeilii]|nr:hypothetical protein BDZ91DRAFT_834697 [Kalaharituber pfeilii]
MSAASLLRAREIIAAMPAAYLKKPEKGESYGLNPGAAKTRLQAYAFSQGFLVSAILGLSSKWLRAVWQDPEYKATGGVSQDEPGKKLRQWQARKLDDGSMQKEWLLGVNELNHTHEMAENPFEYPEHLVFDQDYEKILAEARRLKEAGVSHIQSNNITLPWPSATSGVM